MLTADRSCNHNLQITFWSWNIIKHGGFECRPHLASLVDTLRESEYHESSWFRMLDKLGITNEPPTLGIPMHDNPHVDRIGNQCKLKAAVIVKYSFSKCSNLSEFLFASPLGTGSVYTIWWLWMFAGSGMRRELTPTKSYVVIWRLDAWREDQAQKRQILQSVLHQG